MHNAADMATPKPGEIRCPICHRSTPPAAFCTQCGSAIPPDARARPRGMDRDELQDRIRARRSGGEPYRRGAAADDEATPYERFEPEPEDQRARPPRGEQERRRDYFDERAAAAAAVPAAAVSPPGEEPPSLTRDRDEWLTPVGEGTETAPLRPISDPTPVESAGSAEPGWPAEPAVADVDDGRRVDRFDDAADDVDAYDDGYEYDAWTEPREERSGGGALAIVGFLALGVLALLGGALLAGVFGGGPTGRVDTSPTPSLSAAPTASATPELTPAPTVASAVPSGSPVASGGPIVFPDGFAAEAQPCLPGSATVQGCGSNAAVNSGAVQIWVGFENGTDADVIGAALIGPEGNTLGTGSIDLVDINCRQNCGGYTFFNFSNLAPGTYQVEVTRNGEPAATTSFEVT